MPDPVPQHEIDSFQAWALENPAHATRLQRIAAERAELGEAGHTATEADTERDEARMRLLEAMQAFDVANEEFAQAQARYDALLHLCAEEKQILRMHNLERNLFDTFHPSNHYEDA